MTAPTFVDSNVLVYARDAADPPRQTCAAAILRQLWDDRSGRLSVQVLNEFYVIATRKLSRPLSAEDAWRDVAAFSAWNPQPLDTVVLSAAREVELRYKLNWWDCLIVAAAQAQGCSTVLSEDMQDGMTLSGMRIRNPFVPSASEPAGAAYAVGMPPRRRTRRSRMAA